jgi:hypothetical protein
MLFEGWLEPAITLVAALVLAAVLALTLHALAAGMDFTRASADGWVAHVGLNAIGVSIILHVGIGRRWPFTEEVTAPDNPSDHLGPGTPQGRPEVGETRGGTRGSPP